VPSRPSSTSTTPRGRTGCAVVAPLRRQVATFDASTLGRRCAARGGGAAVRYFDAYDAFATEPPQPGGSSLPGTPGRGLTSAEAQAASAWVARRVSLKTSQRLNVVAGAMPRTVALAVGARAVVRSNLAVARGVANGSRGVVTVIDGVRPA